MKYNRESARRVVEEISSSRQISFFVLPSWSPKSFVRFIQMIYFNDVRSAGNDEILAAYREVSAKMVNRLWREIVNRLKAAE